MLKTVVWGIALSFCFLAGNSHGTILYKRYLVYNLDGTDILCEPYIVQKNDYVIKVFEQKGEISYADFPEFLNIFKRINPEISNVNKIHPGQRLFIPLKKIAPNSYAGQASGIIEIPFIPVASITSLIRSNSVTYTIQKGDYISRVISQMYGKYGSSAYDEGVRLFKMINPEITDINRVYPGQEIKVPDSSLQNQPWYFSVFDNEKIIVKEKKNAPKPKVVLPDEKETESAIVHKESGKGKRKPFLEAARLFEANLLNRGSYYFPGGHNSDFRLNLAFHPIIQFSDGKRILLYEKGSLSEDQKKIVKKFWKNLYWGELPVRPSFEDIVDSVFSGIEGLASKNHYGLKDHSLLVKLHSRWSYEKAYRTGDKYRNQRVQIFLLDNKNEIIPRGLSEYFKTKNIIVKNILNGKDITAKPSSAKEKKTSISYVHPRSHSLFISSIFPLMGFSYQKNVSITFNYAGSDIRAQSNLLKNADGEDVLIDFGDLYGDAIYAIEKSGIKVISIDSKSYLRKTALKILDAMKVTYELNPLIRKSLSKSKQYCSMTIPGILVKKSINEKYLITTAAISEDLASWLHESSISVIRLQIKNR